MSEELKEINKSDFLRIREAALWDNCKRKANTILKKIEKIKNTKKRLEIFTKPKFSEIQDLLDDIGKEFFRIFLYKAIEQGFADGKSAEETVKKFQFFFWPGYTTLTGKRIFIEGIGKPDSDKHKYFTGVGNRKFETINYKTFNDYFLRKANNTELLTDDPVFWRYHIPSTLAFDSIMNQFYLDLDAKGFQPVFVAGSTHHWKSIQRENLVKEEVYLPMPLKVDSSEFRILEVKSDKDVSYTLVKSGENKISITIPQRELGKAGEIIANKLHPDKLPVQLKEKDAATFTWWPKSVKEEKNDLTGGHDQKLFDLQKLAYSFWLSETLNCDSKPLISYADIRREFEKNGYGYLAERIQPFKKRVQQTIQPDEFTELYYEYWYTLFLESYGTSVDLGTAMLLTNHHYSPEFLMKCSLWIRWIYNELRLIEAKASETIATENNDIRQLSHHLNGHIEALVYWSQVKLKPKLSKFGFETTDYLIRNISSYLFVSTSVDEDYILNRVRIDLGKEIKNSLVVFKILTLDVKTFNRVFRKGIPNEEMFSRYKNLKFLKYKLGKVTIYSDLDLVKLLFKDLFENMIKHCKYGEPDCKIQLQMRKGELFMWILNSEWPSEDDLFAMKRNLFDTTKTGWRNIIKLVKSLKWEIKVPQSLSDYLIGEYFWIQLKIKD